MLGLWDPFAEFARFDRKLRSDDRPAPAFKPAVDIYEGKDAIVVKAELPGVKVEDVGIQVENDILTLSGERKLDKVEDKDGWHRVESTYGSFTRSFQLPKNVDTGAIEASMTDGVLTLKLPKRAEAQPRRIQVKVGSKPAEAAH
jgi:HSP20 family protein